MARSIEDPVKTTVPWAGGEKVERTSHPAFGQIGVSRVNGHTALYGSDFIHNNYMVIRISRSELQRNLARDWAFQKEEIIEVALSEAQWAAFVSSPNMGGGVQCTIQREGHKTVPGLPPPLQRTEQFSGEAEKLLKDAVDRLDATLAKIDSLGLPKGKAAQLREEVNAARRNLSGGLPFIAQSFGEHAETIVENAKAEIHGYMNGVITRAGLNALTNGAPPPLALEDKSADIPD